MGRVSKSQKKGKGADRKTKKTQKPLTKSKRGRPQGKKSTPKPFKLLPGQTLLSFKPRILAPQMQQIKVLCVDENTLGWPTEVTDKIISLGYDNDLQSSQNVVNTDVQKGIANLVQEIAFRQVFKNQEPEEYSESN